MEERKDGQNDELLTAGEEGVREAGGAWSAGHMEENSESGVNEDRRGHSRRAHISPSQGYRGKHDDSRAGPEGRRVPMILSW